jgi:hypothetical protein
MIEHNVGVTTALAYEIKRVDSDYFAQKIRPVTLRFSCSLVAGYAAMTV